MVADLVAGCLSLSLLQLAGQRVEIEGKTMLPSSDWGARKLSGMMLRASGQQGTSQAAKNCGWTASHSPNVHWMCFSHIHTQKRKHSGVVFYAEQPLLATEDSAATARFK